MAFIATKLSANPDEYANLVAGLSYLQSGRFELYSVNPPLLKIFAALPAYIADLRLPTIDHTQQRPEFQAGLDFAVLNGPRAELALIFARWVCALATILGTIGAYCLATATSNEKCGCTAAILWASSPITLGYGAIVSFDIAAASFVMVAAMAIIRWMQATSWQSSGSAACWIALALLTKTTWLIMLPLVFLTWLLCKILFIRECAQDSPSREKPPSLSQLFVVLSLAVFLLNGVYRFQGTGRALSSYEFQSQTMIAVQSWTLVHAVDLPIPIPSAFVGGIDQQKLDFEQPRHNYRFGQVHDTGVWYYYLLGLAISLPTGLLVCWVYSQYEIILRILIALRQRNPVRRLTLLQMTTFLFLPLSVLIITSSQLHMNNHLRYSFAILGLMTVTAAVGIGRIGKSRRSRWILTICLAESLAGITANFPFCHNYASILSTCILDRSETLGGSAADWYQGWWEVRSRIEGRQFDQPTYIYVSRWTNPAVHQIAVGGGSSTLSLTEDWNLVISVADRQHLSEEIRERLDLREKELIAGTVEIYRMRGVDWEDHRASPLAGAKLP